jgi:hypothetical protein
MRFEPIVVVEFVGAVAILLPFALLQARRLTQHAIAYLLLNLLGGAVLTVVAVLQQQWGFVILQAAWCAVAVWGLARRRGRTEAGTGATGHRSDERK